jgi:hypothetical protein
MSDSFLPMAGGEVTPEPEKPGTNPEKKVVWLTNAELPDALREMNDGMLESGIITPEQHAGNLVFIEMVYSERKAKNEKV